MQDARADFTGVGWAFPVHTDATGAIALVGGDAELEQSIALIVGTAPGERPMRPEFGCAIHDYVFAPADVTTAAAIAYEVRAALVRWEPRIEVGDVEVLVDPEEHGTLYVDVAYRAKSTNSPRNLVFPFYTIPAEA